MIEAVQYLSDIGNVSLSAFWFPVLLWTILAGVVILVLRYTRISPLYQYHVRAATLLSLPAGIGLSLLTSYIGSRMPEETATAAKWIVIQAPAMASAPGPAKMPVSEPVVNWGAPELWMGVLISIVAITAAIRFITLCTGFIRLRTSLHTYNKIPLTELRQLSTANSALVDSLQRTPLAAFSGKVNIPHTWGLRKPVIILPENVRDNPERLNMIVRHELTHIRRGDYPLNLFLLVVKTIFWFHPLVYRIYRELIEYREISCDREVLNDLTISQKQYAQILTELASKSNTGRLTAVSMSVNRSTLKKRIHTMRDFNQTTTPFRKSMLVAFLASFIITGLIGCSDLKQSDLSGEELLNQKINLTNATIAINGKTVKENLGPGIVPTGNELAWPANGILTLTIGEYGTFLISGQKFEGAEPNGKISGNQLIFSVNEMNVYINAPNNILDRETASLWVAHDPRLKKPHAEDNASMTIKWYTDYPGYAEYRDRYGTADDEDTEQKSFFVAVQQMPKLIGGAESIYSRIEYPETARKAGIEGRVIVQFIVNKQGKVEYAEILRGIGAGCDMEALKAIRESDWEPGRQRGMPVSVKMTYPVEFQLTGSDTPDTQNGKESGPEPVNSAMEVEFKNSKTGVVTGRVTDRETGEPLTAANIVCLEHSRGAATDQEGRFTITNLSQGEHRFRISFVGYEAAFITKQVD